jgi:hypothetical protein
VSVAHPAGARVVQAAGASIWVSAPERSQMPAAFPVAAGKVVTIPHGTQGLL